MFFDEFETLGKERGDVHETGEIKRVVSPLLMQIDALPSYVIAIGATNHDSLLDKAAWRRFQIRLEIPRPSRHGLEEYYRLFEKRYSFRFGLQPSFDAEFNNIEPDDDFYQIDYKTGERSDKMLNGRLYCVMSNQQAMTQLISLWQRYQHGETIAFKRGFTDQAINHELNALGRRIVQECVVREICYHGILAELPRDAIEGLVNRYEARRRPNQHSYVCTPYFEAKAVRI